MKKQPVLVLIIVLFASLFSTPASLSEEIANGQIQDKATSAANYIKQNGGVAQLIYTAAGDGMETAAEFMSMDYSDGSPQSIPWSKYLSVPYYEQPDSYTCGPTSLMMIMEYYGVRKTVNQISKYCAGIGDSPYYDGIGPATIVSAAKYYGFPAAAQKYGWSELKRAIEDNHPVIGHLHITAGGNPRCYPDDTPLYSSFTGGHYVVVRGLQADANGNVLYVVINDPSKGSNIKITYASFDSSWAQKSRRIVKLK